MYEPLAIVGCGMRLPGSVDNGQAFWDFLINKQEARGKIPTERFNIDAFHGPGKPGCISTLFGNFLEHVDLSAFDTSFWPGLPATEVAQLDPQLRLLLEVVHECIENAGAIDLAGKKVGTYVGCFGGDWSRICDRDPTDDTAQSLIIEEDYNLANRLAYEFGFSGPSVVVRTACSASLTGLHEACMAIKDGQCDSAIVAGTSLLLDPSMFISMSQQGMLAADGRCKTFDAAADGYARAEGVVAVHVKRLSDAVRDNDTIRAVIRATAVNADGNAGHFFQPNSAAHEAIMRRVHELAGITDLSKMAMMECHGTGTATGDPKEASAVAKVFGEHGLFIGSAKPNFGHAEGASGLVSVIKMILALEHRMIPPNINFKDPNPKIPFHHGRLVVPVEPREWPADKAERVGINNFGIGGANAHVLLESASQMGLACAARHGAMREPYYLLTFSAAHEDALEQVVRTHEQYLRKHADRLPDLSYTLAVRRRALSYRTFVLLSEPSAETQLDPFPYKHGKDTSPVAFVFTGQGAQWHRMGAELLDTNPTFRASIDRAEDVLRACAHPPTWRLGDELRKSSEDSRLSEAALAQPCCTALQLALVDVLKTWGVVPTSVVGHSSGEIAAGYASGTLSFEDSIRVAYYRGRVVSGMTLSGTMAAVGLGRQSVEPFLRPGVIVGCENGSSSVTLTGDVEAVKGAVEDVKATLPNTLTKLLPGNRAYHSSHMNTIKSEYQDSIRSITARMSKIPFISSVTGELHDQPLDAAYWARNLASPVLFLDATKCLLQRAPANFVLVEIGPHPALSGPIRQTTLEDNQEVRNYVPTLRRGEDSAMSLMKCAGQLFQNRVELKLDAVVTPGKCLQDLPTYPWQRQSGFWAESVSSKNWRHRRFPKHELLGDRVDHTSDSASIWKNALSLEDAPWLDDHRISSQVVFPGMGYLAMAGEAVRQLCGVRELTYRRVHFKEMLVLSESSAKEVVTHLTPMRYTTKLDSDWYDFQISSFDSSGQLWTRHILGQVRAGTHGEAPSIGTAGRGREIDKAQFYTKVSKLGISFGPSFRNLDDIKVTQDIVSARVESSPDLDLSAYSIHPATLDAVGHSIFAACCRGELYALDKLSLPQYIEEVSIKPTIKPICCRSEITESGSDSIVGNTLGVVDDDVVVHLRGLKMKSVVNDTTNKDGTGESHGAAELVFRPDMTFLNPASRIVAKADHGEALRHASRMTIACLVDGWRQLQDCDPVSDFLAKYKRWMQMSSNAASKGGLFGIADCKDISGMSPADCKKLIHSLYEHGVKGELEPLFGIIHAVHEGLEELMRGEAHGLDLMHRQDMLARLYTCVDDADMSDFCILTAHQKPNLRILEIGAGTGATTEAILNQLASLCETHGRYYCSYTFTDISSGFFDAAEKRFAQHDAIEFRTLDISKNPLEQGFEEQSYDLVVASNVIHATPNLAVTLSHVRTLLAPGGKFCLHEISLYLSEIMTFTMGTLSGWWVAEEEERSENPGLSSERWAFYLQEAGFEAPTAHHRHTSSTYIASPRQDHQAATLRVNILSTELESTFVKNLTQALTEQGHNVELLGWKDDFRIDHGMVVVLDVGQNRLDFADEGEFTATQTMLKNLRHLEILWVTGMMQVGCSNPSSALVLGLARALRNEMDITMATLEVEDSNLEACNAITSILPKLHGVAQETSRPDMEWVLLGGSIHVGRLQPLSVSSRLIKPGNGKHIRLESGDSSALTAFHWEDFEPPNLEENMVEIKPCTVGLNFRDVLLATRHIERDQHSQGVGFEVVGEVVRIGSHVKHLAPGDMCATLSNGYACSTSLTCPANNCLRIPKNLAPEEAVGMITVFTTVLYALEYRTKVREGDSILIHSACGGVGIAAIQMSRLLGLEVYCTVGTEEKINHLVQEWDIPRDRIFSSRDTTFKQDLLQATDGRGVDIVLNSLAGELLHASWDCVAPYGCMLELGRRDHAGDGKLELRPFLENKSYIGIYLNHLVVNRPDLFGSLLARVWELYDQGLIRPITPTTCYSAHQVPLAMKAMSKGEHMGKIVIQLPEDASDLPVEPSRKVNLRPQSCYVIVGGLGGLGELIATWLAKAGAAEIIFLSRSAGDDPKHGILESELQQLGCTARFIRGSVVEPADVDRALESAILPIRGVLQLAMVLKDGPFDVMPYSDWKAVVDPKVKGTWNIHNSCKDRAVDLDFFIMTGSLMSLLGLPGQANYVSANAFLDAFAQYRWGLGLPAFCIQVGVVAEVGYVSRDDKISQRLATLIEYTMGPRELLDALHLAIDSSKPLRPSSSLADSASRVPLANSRMVGTMTTGVWSNQSASQNTSAMLRSDPKAAVLQNIGPRTSVDTEAKADKLDTFLADIESDPSKLTTAETAQFLATEIRKAICRLTMTDETVTKLEGSLEAAGIDSLMSVELRSWFLKRMRIRLRTTDLLGSRSILSLGELSATLLHTRMK